MDFANRNARTPQAGAQHADSTGHSPAPGTSKRNSKFKKGGRLGQVLYVIFSVAVIVLVIAVLFSVVFGKNQREAKYVDDTKLQAVFLNGGQVYFGNITSLNQDYLKLKNVYYLRVNNQNTQDTKTTTANDVSLVKLGCELHGPQDQMLITKSQVIFWENLKSDGQVAKAVAEYIKTNPNGQKCEDANTGSTGTNLQNNSTGTTNTTGTGTTNTNTANPQKP